MTIQKRKQFSYAVIFSALSVLLASCGGSDDAVKSTGGDSLPRFEAKSQCGNDSSYTINGQHYKVLPSAAGYKKEGLASWYGAAYQGSQTASCETFDMFSYTAAHRTLPLPSYVKVTNKKNGKSVIVKVNDRGPFGSSNEIELSFAAANAISMVKSKVAPVSIEALTPDQYKGHFPNHASSNHSATGATSTNRSSTYVPKTPNKIFYVIVGTYRNSGEAVDMFVRLSSIGISKAEMATAFGNNQKMHMVRVGPLYNQDQIDNIKDRLTQDGLTSFRVIDEDVKQ